MATDKPTEPLDDTRGDIRSFNARLPAELLDRMDMRAKTNGLSRNAWMEKAIDWVLTYLPTGVVAKDRDLIASLAPNTVAGIARLPKVSTGEIHKYQSQGPGTMKCKACGHGPNDIIHDDI